MHAIRVSIGIGLLAGILNAQFRVIVKSGDVIDGRRLENMGTLLSMNDNGIVAFEASAKTTGESFRGIFTPRSAVMDRLKQPGFVLGEWNRLTINNAGQIAFNGTVNSNGREIVNGIWLNDQLMVNQYDYPARKAGAPIYPHLAQKGELTFAMGGTVYALRGRELLRQVNATVSGHAATILKFDRNDAGETVFTSSWMVRPGVTFAFPQVNQLGIFTHSKLIHEYRIESNGDFMSNGDPRINASGQIAYLDAAPEYSDNNILFAVYVDGKPLPWRGVGRDLQFNDRGTVLLMDSRSRLPVLIRDGEVRPLLTTEMVKDKAMWAQLKGKPDPAHYAPSVDVFCTLNNLDRVACIIKRNDFAFIALIDDERRAREPLGVAIPSADPNPPAPRRIHNSAAHNSGAALEQMKVFGISNVVKITMHDGTEVNGTWGGSDLNSIQVEVDGVVRSIPKAAVKSVDFIRGGK